MKQIGVFGGTFDPIHYGHLWPVEEIINKVGLDAVLYVPNANPPHRALPATNAKDRAAMMALALEKFPLFEMDLRELDRTGPSYSVVTLESLQQDYPNFCLCLILGLDAFLELPSWYQWQQVFALANVVVMERPGEQLPRELPKWWQERNCKDLKSFKLKKAGGVIVVPVNPVNISATDVRSAIKSKHDISKLVPAPVIEYIITHNLYH